MRPLPVVTLRWPQVSGHLNLPSFGCAHELIKSHLCKYIQYNNNNNNRRHFGPQQFKVLLNTQLCLGNADVIPEALRKVSKGLIPVVPAAVCGAMTHDLQCDLWDTRAPRTNHTSHLLFHSLRLWSVKTHYTTMLWFNVANKCLFFNRWSPYSRRVYLILLLQFIDDRESGQCLVYLLINICICCVQGNTVISQSPIKEQVVCLIAAYTSRCSVQTCIIILTSSEAYLTTNK